MRDFQDVVCLTLDVDWAPEEVLQSAVDTLAEEGLKATFFATHDSEVLGRLTGDQFEVGIHPNFNDSGGDIEGPIARLKDAYPAAVGGRSHSLFVSSRILEAYARNGLRYESNIFLLAHEGLHPVPRFDDLVSLPFNWSDDKHLELGLPFRASEVRLGQRGIKVLNLHPIHLFMNTRDTAHYQSFRALTGDIEALSEHVNRDGEGIATLFSDVAREIAERGLRVALMRELQEEFHSDSR